MIAVVKRGLVVVTKITVFLWYFRLLMNRNFLVLRRRRKTNRTKMYPKDIK